MSDDLSRVYQELERLGREVRKLERRLAALEAGGSPHPTSDRSAAGPTAAVDEAPVDRTPGTFTSVLTLSGRTLLILGGGLLLRALTDAGLLTQEVGVVVGLSYALAWVGFADRMGTRGQRLNAAFYALSSVLIAYPLLWEATTKLHFFSAHQVAGLMGLCTAVGLLVAWRRRLRSVAWAFTIAPLVLTYALVPATRTLAPLAAFSLVLGLATVWLAYERDWKLARWPVALAGDGLVLLAVMWVSQPGGPPAAYRPLPAGTAQALALALPIIYLGSAALRTLARRREVSLFEAVQGATALFLGFGGAVRVARATGGQEWVMALIAMGAAAVCYILAFTFVDRTSATRRNFYFYGWLALGLVLLGSGVMAHGLLLPLLWGGLAVAAAVVGTLYDRFTLRVHSAVYATLAAIQGGLLKGAAVAFAAPAGKTEAALPPSAFVVLGAVAVAFAVLASTHRVAELPWHRRLPRFAVGTVLVIGLGAAVVTWTVSVLLGGATSADPAVLAVIRTAVLSLAAVALAFGVPRVGLFEMTWLVHPLIIIGGIKFLAEDLPHGRPATLFLGLACYGTALIGASRVLRARRLPHKDAPA
jgi:hypothetical protein